MKTTKIKIGSKEITFAPKPDGSVQVSCACGVLNKKITIDITEGQACEILGNSRRPIQGILPAHDRRIREIFISGTTPAEFDIKFSGRLRADKTYAKLGYEPDRTGK